jgi:hypothetical protein
VINVLVLEISPYDFLLGGPQWHNASLCVTKRTKYNRFRNARP